jgi:hypothetical protein
VIRFLVALYPKAWRRAYGEEFKALLEQTRLTPLVILDVLAQAVARHASVRRIWLAIGTAVLASAGVEIFAKKAGLTANILWLATDLTRAVALLALVAPWVGVAVWARRARTHRPPARG